MRAVQGSFATMTAVAALMALQRPACAGPTGGTVVEGSAGISQAGTVTNINQSSSKAIINWQGFSIAPQETVNFNQPGASAMTLNRVIGNEQSVISGALNANGQVFIVNSAGVLISKGAQVNVGGLVASTLDISNKDFLAGNYVFSGSSQASIVNQGKIHAAPGGYVALLGKTVSNQGVISATLGTVVMASGEKITLNFGGDSLVDVTIDKGTLNVLVENKQLIKADGGRVIMTAKAADAVLSAQVNNTGVIQARTMAALKGGSGATTAAHVGSIKLLASGGTVNVAGKLDASAPKGGNGGKIETSGNSVKVAKNAVITTKSAKGTDGAWTIDPDGFTIGVNGDIAGATLTSELANTSVTISSTNGSGTGGNINVNDAVSWSTNTLTLNATNNIYVNAIMTATGTASFAANYGHVLNASGNPTATVSDIGYGTVTLAGGETVGVNADHTPMGLYAMQSAVGPSYGPATYTGQINFSGSGSVTLNGTAYTVINDATGLAAVANDLSGHYVLGSNVSTAWNSLTPIGSNAQPFSGVFDGFGHGLNIGVQSKSAGLFGTIGANGMVSNLSVYANLQPDPNNQGSQTTDPTVNTTALGILADINRGTIVNSIAAGNITAVNANTAPKASVTDVGGFVGENYGLIANSYASATVGGAVNIGGFVGYNEGTGAIYASAVRYDAFNGGANVNSSSSTVAYAGGFAGENSGVISQSYARDGVDLTDAALGSSLGAGFVGKNNSTGTIDQSYVYYKHYDGSDGVAAAHVAGFVGDNAGTITNSYSAAFASVTGAPAWDSAFAYINSGTISTSYAIASSGSSGNQQSYGFVAINNGGTTTNDYWYSPQYGDRPAPIDNSTATQLTQAQSTNFASYAGFNPTIWAASSQGYPLLKQLALTVTPTSSVAYGASQTDILNSLKIAGLQWVDTTQPPPLPVQLSVVTPSSGYLNAGTYTAGSVLTSPAYVSIQGSVTISPQTLTLASGVVQDKTYDGTTAATVNNGLANGGLVGLVGNQTLTINYQSASFASKNAGQESATVVFTVADGTNGGLASNYTISNTTTATINPKSISTSFSAADKTYDGSANAVVTTQLNGVVSGDTVALSWASAQFSDKNAAQNKTVTMAGLALTGADEGNYTLQATTLQSTATISPRVVDLYGTETSASATSFPAANLYVKNTVPGDMVNLTGTVTLARTTAGVQPITSVSSASLNNPNYTLIGATGSVLIGNASLALDHIVYGTVTISSSGASTTITESTDKAIIDWLRFSIASNETVNFVQPASTSIILNRVTGNEQSVIDGALNANGRVFIVNSNGVVFSGASEVNVGALVATTLNIDNVSFESGIYQFATAGGAGSVTAAGPITAANGGFIVLASGAGVTTSGSLSSLGGAVVIAATNNMTLNLDSAGLGLASYALSNLSGVANVDGNLNVGAVSGNGGLIETAGDTVVLSDSLAMHTGIGGTWSYSQNGDITVGARGAFSAQSIEANLATRNLSLNSYLGAVSVNDAVTWSADTNLTLAAGTNININNAIKATGDHAGLTLSYGGFSQTGTAASGYDYYINSQTIGGDGSITRGPGVVTLTGDNASLSINGNAYTLIQSISQLEQLSVLEPGVTNYNTFGPAYTIPNGYYALGQDLVATQTYSGPVINTFAGVLAGLGHKIDGLTINGTAGNSGYGLIGVLSQSQTDWSTFQTVTGPGVVRDLGLTNINISGPGLSRSGGLAGQSGTGSTINNVYVTGSISGGTDSNNGLFDTGGLVGVNDGLINNAHVNISLYSPGIVEYVGGLVGWNSANDAIKNSSAADYSAAAGGITVLGNAFADGGYEGSWALGGLVGWNIGTVDHSFANMTIKADTTTDIGGLVGLNYQTGTTTGTANITNSSSGGSITAENKSTLLFQDGNIGGLVGDNQGGALTNVSSTTNITVTAAYHLGPGTSGGLTNNEGNAFFSNVGGLVGNNDQSFYTNNSGTLANASYSGNINVKGYVDSVGGAVGVNGSGAVVTGVTTSGTITATNGPDLNGVAGAGASGAIGGIIGSNGASLSNSSSSVTVNAGNASNVGGAVGSNGGTIANVSVSGTGSVTGNNAVGGLVGSNFGSISNSTAGAPVTGQTNVGGLAGENIAFGSGGAIDHSSATGPVKGVTNVGGLVGFNGGSVIGSIARGDVQGVTDVGGLIGTNGGRDQYGNSWNASVDSSSAYGNATGVTNVGALIGLNNDGGLATSLVTNSSAFGAAFVGGKDTGDFIGQDLGTSRNNTYEDVPAEKAAALAAQQAAEAAAAAKAAAEAAAAQAAQQAAAVQAAQNAAAASQAATVIATTGTAQAAATPEGASVSSAGTQAVYSVVAPNVDDNIKITTPPPPPAPAATPERRAPQKRVATAASSGGHRTTHGAGSGGGFGATIRSIEINGQHFNLEGGSGRNGQ